MNGCDCSVSSVLAAKAEATNQQISVAVSKKALDAAKLQGAAMIELIKAARPANEPGQGTQIDTYA